MIMNQFPNFKSSKDNNLIPRRTKQRNFKN